MLLYQFVEGYIWLMVQLNARYLANQITIRFISLHNAPFILQYYSEAHTTFETSGTYISKHNPPFVVIA